MGIGLVRGAYENWEPFVSIISPDLNAAIAELRSNPTFKSDAFFASVVADFNQESGSLWVDEAVHYSQHAYDKEVAVSYLTDIITDYNKFGVLGGTLGAAASYLGKMTAYPNADLARVMEMDVAGLDEVEGESLRLLRCPAYGAYVMTATDFNKGLEAGRAMKASGSFPTVPMAEKFIQERREKLAGQVLRS